MTTYTIEVNHNEDGISVVVKNLDPDTANEDREAIAFALEEALRITREQIPQRLQ